MSPTCWWGQTSHLHYLHILLAQSSLVITHVAGANNTSPHKEKQTTRRKMQHERFYFILCPKHTVHARTSMQTAPRTKGQRVSSLNMVIVILKKAKINKLFFFKNKLITCCCFCPFSAPLLKPYKGFVPTVMEENDNNTLLIGSFSFYLPPSWVSDMKKDDRWMPSPKIIR